MSTSFSALKKTSGSVNIAKLAEVAASLNTKKDYNDARFWTPTVGPDKNGSAIIRFLPAPKGEDIAWVRFWEHSFKGPTGGWYIEKSLTSLGKPDPVSELNTLLWDTGTEANKKIASARKRNLRYISWIKVISDPKKPENNGKIFLFKYGKKIHDKIIEAGNPSDQTETPVCVYDFWEGANFRLKIKDQGGFRNYDSSVFDSKSALSNDDKELEEIWTMLTPLNEFLDPKNFKSYDELKARLTKVVGNNPLSVSAGPTANAPSLKTAEATTNVVDEEDDGVPPFDTDDTDDALAKFRAMAEED